MRTLVRLRLAALLAAALPLAAACDNPFASDAREELSDARLRWERAGIDDYQYRVTRHCFCGFTGPMLVTVVDGAVVSRVFTESGQPVPANVHARIGTVDDLFELLEAALDEDPAEFDASYDGQLGYPVSASIDYSVNVADEEDGFGVSEFIPTGLAR
ncbi:MAG TPA: DUF6174 domain-containing protein [Longimicrobium sp.]